MSKKKKKKTKNKDTEADKNRNKKRTQRAKPAQPIAAGPAAAVPRAIRKVGCSTVDGSSSDATGFLQDTRDRLHPPEHDTTSQAIDNLLKCLSGAAGQSINIIGHGLDGCISTGIGDADPTAGGQDPDKFVSDRNQDVWQQDLARLKDARVASLTLWGCNTGAGTDGAKLLFAIANLIGAPVSAPTGLVYPGTGSDDFQLEPRSVMQQAKPGKTPPKKRNSPKYLQILKKARSMQFNENGTIISLPPTALRSTHFFKGPHLNSGDWTEWMPANATKKNVSVRFDHPFTLPGPIPAVVTGSLVATINRNGVDEKRLFRVYNNRIAQDVASPTTYYYTQIAGKKG